MAYETILLAKDRGVGTITFNRPRVLNAINQQMLSDVDEALTDLEQDQDIRVIVVTGAGRAFSAGRDLKEIGGATHRTGAEVWSRLETIAKPVIAAVNGLCYTGALSMLTCFDLVVASETAVFADTHTRYGMVHGGGSTQRLRNLVGARRAKQLIFTCEPISAAEAERIGLVNQVVGPADLEGAVRDLADKIIRNDATAIGIAKRLINDGQTWGTAVGFELEARAYRRQRREQPGELKSRFDAFFEDR